MSEPRSQENRTATSLLTFLETFTGARRNDGRTLQLAGRVRDVDAGAEETRANVWAGYQLNRVVLRPGEAGIAGECSCGRERCEHQAAVAYEWLDRIRGEAAGGTLQVERASRPDLSRGETFRQKWEPLLAEKLGRPLSDEEGAFLGKLSQIYNNAKNSHGRVFARDLHHLGFRTQESARVYGPLYEGWWERLPADPLALWQYIAYDLENSGVSVPEFMRPVTDTAPIRARLHDRERKKAVARWSERFHQLSEQARVSPPPAPEPPKWVDLRVVVMAADWWLESRWRPDGPWVTPPRPFLDRLNRAHDMDADIVASPAVYAFLALCREHCHTFSSARFGAKQFGAPELLHRLLQHPLARTLIVDHAEKPVRIAEAPLVWEVSPSEQSERSYELSLRLPDGRPLPGGSRYLPGNPPYYLVGSTIYPGPPALDGTSVAGAIVPTEAVEDPETLRTLRALGTRFPPELEQRFSIVPLGARLICHLEPDPLADYENLVLELHATRPDQKRVSSWTASDWQPPLEQLWPAPQDRIEIVDDALPRTVAAMLPQLKASYSQHRAAWLKRVTRTFAEDFLAWRQTLPAGAELIAKGELATLLDDPVHARLDLELLETKAHRDWFDLALALRPEDTTLTPEEIKLLLKARGKLVRLEGKGWKRLTVEIDDAAREALATAGFDANAAAEAALGGERQRFHAIQLANTKLADALPERQAAALRHRAISLTAVEPALVPATLRAELRPYQREGFQFLAFLSANALGGILADDMGLGKTVQTLAWLLWLAERPNRSTPLHVLVVCPKSVMSVWESEAARFAPTLKVMRFTPALKPPTRRGAKAAAATAAPRPTESTMVVANYAQVRLNESYFSDQAWDAIVLDEGQFIKNPSSKIAQIVRELPAANRVVLTGTPIENRLLDLWSLFAFALPGLLGSQAAFKRHYADDNPEALSRLRSRVKHFLLRRTKGQVAADLPPRIEEDIAIELEGEQLKLYQAELKRARGQLLHVSSAQDFQKARFNILASLLRLRQICCHPALIAGTQGEIESAKLEHLVERIEDLRDEGHQVLVFSQLVEMLEIIRERLNAAKVDHLMLTGQTENREELVREFQTDRSKTVFLLSLKAAGFGLNLTAASYVILYDPWWNPAVEAQAIDRTHRIGQSVPVNAYRFIAKGTVEEKIRELQREKAALAASVVQEESLTSVLDLDSLKRILE
jgi:superfamily II DNA or RNA helicase